MYYMLRETKSLLHYLTLRYESVDIVSYRLFLIFSKFGPELVKIWTRLGLGSIQGCSGVGAGLGHGCSRVILGLVLGSLRVRPEFIHCGSRFDPTAFVSRQIEWPIRTLFQDPCAPLKVLKDPDHLFHSNK